MAKYRYSNQRYRYSGGNHSSYSGKKRFKKYRPAYTDGASEAVFWAVIVFAGVGFLLYFLLAFFSVYGLVAILGTLVLVGLSGGAAFWWYQNWRRHLKRKAFLAMKLHEVDRMSGFEFEKYIAQILIHYGYEDVELTPNMNDHGADLLFTYQGQRFAAQLKRYKGSVGVDALYQAAAGRDYYKADRVAVITNSYFGSEAKKHAEETGYWLVDREDIKKWIEALNPPPH